MSSTPQVTQVTQSSILRDCIRLLINFMTEGYDFEGKQSRVLLSDQYSKLVANLDGTHNQALRRSSAWKSLAVDDMTDLQDQIEANKAKMFLIGFHSDCSFLSLIQILQDSKLSDNNLPFAAELCPAGVSSEFFECFRKSQGVFIPMTFKHEDFTKDVDDTTLSIPINGSYETGTRGKGNTGKVFEVTIPDECLSFGTPSGGLVLKRIDTTSHATAEIKAMNHVARLPLNLRQRIANIYSGFKFDKKTYLIAERAKFDLDVFMKEFSPSTPDKINSQWVLSEFRGLAKALSAIQSGVPGSSAFHHDIKTKNILVFPKNDTLILKITDWGNFKVKLINAQSPDGPTSEKGGNPPYLPPECRKGGFSSLSRDVWSLGCVFLEVLIWHTQGWNALEKFRDNIDKAQNTLKSNDWMGTGDDLLPYVKAELERLENNPCWTDVVSTIRRMLRFKPHKVGDPDSRIAADQIEHWF